MQAIKIISESFERLRDQRFFVSEADFQHSLGLELSKSFQNDPDVKIIMEFPIIQNGKTIYIDIMVVKKGDFYPIELKYKTRKIESDIKYAGTNLPIMDVLKNQGAQDLGEYAFWRDINRIETFINNGLAKNGVCIFITNDTFYWAGRRNENSQANSFRIDPGRKPKGSYQWNMTEQNKSKTNTWIHKCPGFDIRNNYEFVWEDFYKMSAKNGEFKSLFIVIPH